MSTEKVFLESAIKKFQGQKKLGDKTFAQLQENDFHFAPSPESNSILVIIQHMHGNMLSRWTNFLTEDGEKPWRQRDAEFESKDLDSTAIIALWEEGWKCVFDALEALQPEDTGRTIYIRTEPLTVIDAIVRQIDHYGYHVGQIVQLGKMIRDKDWQTLSIAKNRSGEYNRNIKANNQ